MLVSVSIGYGSNLPELEPIEIYKHCSITAIHVPNVWVMKHDCVVRAPGILMTCLLGPNASMKKAQSCHNQQAAKKQHQLLLLDRVYVSWQS